MPSEVTREIVRSVETSAGKQLVIKMTKTGILVKEPNQKWATALLCPWGVIHVRAAWLAVEEKKRLKRAARELKKLGRKS